MQFLFVSLSRIQPYIGDQNAIFTVNSTSQNQMVIFNIIAGHRS